MFIIKAISIIMIVRIPSWPSPSWPIAHWPSSSNVTLTIMIILITLVILIIMIVIGMPFVFTGRTCARPVGPDSWLNRG